jgi:hypothetical protein
MKDLIGIQKEEGLWDSDRFLSLSDSEEEEEVQKKLKGGDKEHDAPQNLSSKKLLTIADMQECDPSKHGGLTVPSVMQNLVIVKQHIPFTLFLPESLERFRSNKVPRT